MAPVSLYVESFLDPGYLGISDRFFWLEVKDNESKKTYEKDIFDKKTGDIYKPDKPEVLLGKFVAALLVLPIYASVKMLYHSAHIPYVIAETLFQAALSPRELDCAKQIGKLGAQAIEIVHCGYYYAGISLVLIRGIVLKTFSDPLYAFETRAIVAHLEREWSHNVPRRADYRFFAKHKDFSKVHYFYLAFCFLPVGNINDMMTDGKTKQYTILLSDLWR